MTHSDAWFVIIWWGMIYFFPAMIAMLGEKRGSAGIVALNVFGGWTFIGWLIALVWALSADEKGVRVK